MFLRSPAKVNLFLEVLGRRPDGYHQIETIFQAVDLCDEIELERTEGEIELTCDSKEVPPGEENLAYRAAALLKKEAGVRSGVKIALKKIIPVAAGLGGGSSNAASVLLGLNELWGLNRERERLMELGAGLGADVPFFISGFSTALGRGRGEELTGLSPGPGNWWVVLVIPGVKLLSREIYGALNSTLTGPGSAVKIVINALREKDLAKLESLLFNRLEEAAIKACAEITVIKKALRAAGARCVLMSGSGPAVFGIAGDRKEAAEIKNKLAGRDWRILTARFLNGNFSD